MVHHPLRDYRQTMAKLDGLAAIADATTPDTAWNSLESLTRLLGFRYSGVGVVGDDVVSAGIDLDHASPFFLKSFARYTGQHLHKNDPAAHALAKGMPLVFADVACRTARPELREGAARLQQFFSDEDISAHAALRIDLPNRVGAGFFAFGLRDADAHITFKDNVARHLNVLKLAGMAYAAVCLRSNALTEIDVLSVREAHVLTLVAQGMTVQEIAEQEGRAVVTIRQQLAQARLRLGARTTSHAVMLAQQLGAIRP